MTEVEDFFEGAVFYDTYFDSKIQLSSFMSGRYQIAYLDWEPGEGKRLERSQIVNRIESGEWVPHSP